MTFNYLSSLCTSCRILVLCLCCPAGIGGNTNPIFMAEISPLSLRGALGQLIGVVCYSGIIVGQVLGLTELLGHVSSSPISVLTAHNLLVQKCYTL